ADKRVRKRCRFTRNFLKNSKKEMSKRSSQNPNRHTWFKLLPSIPSNRRIFSIPIPFSLPDPVFQRISGDLVDAWRRSLWVNG
ncbi:unnamed protein product, partial [Brassica rapa subsp. trilocularis]